MHKKHREVGISINPANGGHRKAKLTFDVDTILDDLNPRQRDVILVLDNSGSMGGSKLNKVKDDSKDLTLKEGKEAGDNDTGFFPTNKKEEITADDDAPVTSTETPVLRNYKVHYDSNKPSNSIGTETYEEVHLPFERVAKSWPDGETLAGYIFKGWKLVSPTPDSTKVDYQYSQDFQMPEDDVYLNGTWAKFDISKSMKGQVYESPSVAITTANFVNNRASPDLNKRFMYGVLNNVINANGSSDEHYNEKFKHFKQYPGTLEVKTSDYGAPTNGALVEQANKFKRTYSASYGTMTALECNYAKVQYVGGDGTVHGPFNAMEVQRDEEENQEPQEGNNDGRYADYVDEDTQGKKIWRWLDTTDQTVYWYSDATIVKLNKNCTSMFEDGGKMTAYSAGTYTYDGIETIDLSGFDLSDVEEVSNMFDNCRQLTTIYVNPYKSFDRSKITESYGTFRLCANLVGGNGTHCYPTYQNTYYDNNWGEEHKAMMIVDGTDNIPGFLTAKTN